MKYAKIVILGKPNVGKSTLINNIFQKEMVITSNKPQTTRDLIQLSYQINNNLIIDLIDVPGFHQPKNKLDLFFNAQVKKGIKMADLVIFMFDLNRPFNEEDENCIKLLTSFKINKALLLLNKVDLYKNKDTEQIITFINNKFPFIKTFAISANNKSDVASFKNYLVEFLIKNLPDQVEKNDYIFKTTTEEFYVKELIRQIMINMFKQEIPYGIAIKILQFEYEKNKNLLSIFYEIYLEKKSQKPIVIGKNGNNLKQINIKLREKLNEIYDCKIFTSSNVKVKNNWRNDDNIIKSLGYKK